jgi:hypothetical protein
MHSLISPTDRPILPWVAALPKADLHVHAETDARLDRILARRAGRPSYDWQRWAKRLRAETPPGMPRLARLAADRRRELSEVDALDLAPENFIARVVDLLSEGAADGALLIEVRFGRSTLQQPELMVLFREAEHRVREQHPSLRAEAVMDRPDPDPVRYRSGLDVGEFLGRCRRGHRTGDHGACRRILARQRGSGAPDARSHAARSCRLCRC